MQQRPIQQPGGERPYGQRDPRRSNKRTDNRRRGAGEQGQEEILRHAGILPKLNPQIPLQAIRRASNIHHRMQHRHLANHQRPIRDGQQKKRRHHRQQRHDRVTVCKSQEASKGLQCASVQITRSRRKRQMRTADFGKCKPAPRIAFGKC